MHKYKEEYDCVRSLTMVNAGILACPRGKPYILRVRKLPMYRLERLA